MLLSLILIYFRALLTQNLHNVWSWSLELKKSDPFPCMRHLSYKCSGMQIGII